MLETTERTIDLDRIIREKMGTKARYVPSVAVRWLKHIIHQDEVNRFLWESRDKKGTEWLEECTRYLDMTLDIEGLENLPDKNDGRLYTFVSNHPLGGVDGVALGAIIGRHYDGRFRYLVNDLLMNLPGLAPLCIPINKTGKQSRSFPEMVEAGFSGDNHILMFPAGICSRKIDGQIHDLRGDETRHSAHTLRRAQLRLFLRSCQRMQGSAHQVQYCHALSRRRNVQERAQVVPRGDRKTDTVADIRQVENSDGMGEICAGHGLQTMTSDCREAYKHEKKNPYNKLTKWKKP